MHTAAWGMWATWGVAAIVASVYIAETLFQTSPRAVIITAVTFAVMGTLVLPQTTLSHEGRTFDEIALSLLVWYPIGATATISLLRWFAPRYRKETTHV